jgi:hypothetical protein
MVDRLEWQLHARCTDANAGRAEIQAGFFLLLALVQLPKPSHGAIQTHVRWGIRILTQTG